jgi:L-ascorbate metabolism protein UlaG (beta-lactamase superfamily)
MRELSLDKIGRWARRTALAAVAITVIATVAIVWLWRDRASLDAITWSPYPLIEPRIGAVTMVWLGTTTFLFDDGKTQVLIDGFFSRPSIFDIVLRRPVKSDAATINYAMDEYRMRRLAAVIPAHSHWDHAMDIGAIANRSSASIVGSESTANIARGAGVPEDQIIVAESGASYTFGNFSITLIGAPHGPIGWGGAVPMAGTIDAPLEQPAPVQAYREGGSYSIIIAHPHGTTVVNASGAFVENALDDVPADVVIMGVGLIEGLGRQYAEKYWQAVVTSTGARHVFPVHFDDPTQPFGDVMPYPRVLGNFLTTAEWLEQIRDTLDIDTRLHLPEFGKKQILYPIEGPEA